MDNGLFLFVIFCGFLLIFFLIFLILSTCLGIPLRRSDILSFPSFPTVSRIRAAEDRRRSQRPLVGEYDDSYELDSISRDLGMGNGIGMGGMGSGMGIGRLGMGGLGGEEDWEMMKRPGRGVY